MKVTEWSEIAGLLLTYKVTTFEHMSILVNINSLKFDYKAGIVDEDAMQGEFINQYNLEIDAATADIDAGNFVLHEDVEKLFADRRQALG